MKKILMLFSLLIIGMFLVGRNVLMLKITI